MFTTFVRFKYKAHDRAIAVAPAKEHNAVIGAHRRSLHLFVTPVGERGCPRAWTALQRLPRAAAITCALRLATHAGSLAEHDNITLKEHFDPDKKSEY